MNKLPILLITILIYGCGTMNISDLERAEINQGEKVHIFTNNDPYFFRFFGDPIDVTILRVDDTSISNEIFSMDQEIAVKPGAHSIRLLCQNTESGKEERCRVKTITINAVQGKKYEIYGKKDYLISQKSCKFKIREINQK